MMPCTSTFMVRLLEDQPKEATGKCTKKVHGLSELVRTIYPLVNLRYDGTHKKERNQTCPRHCAQSGSHNNSESSSSDVQRNVTPEDHSPRATRALTKRVILQKIPPQSEEGGGSDESESGSQEAANTPSPTVNANAEIRAQEGTDAADEEVEITDDDTMVMYVDAHEPDPALRPQLIAYYRSMWTMNQSEFFFNNGIMTKTGSFKMWEIMPETRVVVADIKALLDIY
uniref:Integrase core domain containing protein n=1 Tax=Solanum tuberosum TaxID=4113 RepID=M1DQE7_SOLTU